MNDLLSWHGLLPDDVLLKLLREHVLSKWLTVLQSWLDQLVSGEDFSQGVEELIQWYLGWKRVIPKDIRERQEVEEVFRWALEVIEIRCINNS